jgi:hypothetical protein
VIGSSDQRDRYIESLRAFSRQSPVISHQSPVNPLGSLSRFPETAFVAGLAGVLRLAALAQDDSGEEVISH